jgi:transglutaminase-like putative cysteine protease
MYWRGPVLWNFDGHTWTAGLSDWARSTPGLLVNLTLPIDYTVTLEPHNKRWLFALEMPTKISIPANMTSDFQVLQKSPITSRQRYSAQSQLGYRANLEENPRLLKKALSYPKYLNPRSQKLAAEWRNQFSNDEAVVRSALTYFNRENFQYTLSPPPLGTNEIDDFLFDTRKGFCEHYASSFVYLMRAAGVPARVVTGYQGGEYNQLGNYYIVRQSDAHAWAEVWFRGRGWVRIDPTAAIAPSRIERGMAATLPEKDMATLPFFARTQSTWLLNLRFNLDTLTNQWNQWVLGYNPERQFALLARLGMEEISWQNMALTMLAGIALLVGIFTLLMLRQLTRQETDQAQRLYLKFCNKLAQGGVQRCVHEGPQDFALRAASIKPHRAAAIHDITSQYVALRYGKQPESRALQALHRAVVSFKL